MKFDQGKDQKETFDEKVNTPAPGRLSFHTETLTVQMANDGHRAMGA
jgi:hypothetical protein